MTTQKMETSSDSCGASPPPAKKQRVDRHDAQKLVATVVDDRSSDPPTKKQRIAMRTQLSAHPPNDRATRSTPSKTKAANFLPIKCNPSRSKRVTLSPAHSQRHREDDAACHAHGEKKVSFACLPEITTPSGRERQRQSQESSAFRSREQQQKAEAGRTRPKPPRRLYVSLVIKALLCAMFLLMTPRLAALAERLRFLVPPPREANAAALDARSHEFLAQHPHIIGPTHRSDGTLVSISPTTTLRTFLQNNETGFSLAMAPAFFGFYGYFGVLAAWDEQLATEHGERFLDSGKIRGLTGASAGAMAAVLLAAGIPPRVAADFCSSITLDKFADFPGLGGVFRGNLFEKLMEDFLAEHVQGSDKDRSLLLLQNARHPVAVTAFCLQSLQGKVLTEGSMARAARASATFPLLFEPVGWRSDDTDYTLIDGGLQDFSGVAALEQLFLREEEGDNAHDRRVVNLKVGPFWDGEPPGPSAISGAPQEVLSISLQNLPQCGPWAMEMGPVAVQAAHDAILASLDLPLFVSISPSGHRHFELHIDASTFWEGS